jgi:hypothetical protein
MAAAIGATGAGEVRSPSRQAATSKENALWLLEKFVPRNGINNVGAAIQAAGRLRHDALSDSIAIMIDRYETLRTVFFASDAELAKEVLPPGGLRVEIEQIQLSGGSTEDDLGAFVGRPFDLAGQALIRVGIAAHPDGDILCLAVHHLIFDAISITIFIRAFIPVYEAVATGRPVPSDEGKRPLVEPAARAASLAYWQENLRGFTPDGLELWCGRQRGRHPMMTGKTVTYTLCAEARRAVLALHRQLRAPAAAVLLAAYYALLAAHGAGPDLVIGSPIDVRPINGRGASQPPVIGYHVNVVPLRLWVDFAESFRQLTRRTRDVFLGAMTHADASVDDMAAVLPRAGSSWQATLYRHMFNYLPDLAAADLTVDGMAAEMLQVENGFSKFDLELFVVPLHAQIRFRYRDEILDRADVEALLRRYEGILLEAARDADRPLGETAGWSELDRAIITGANQGSGPRIVATGDDLPPALGRAARAAGTRASILSPDGRELPVRVPGELFLADPDGTRHPTGQLARWLPDGTLERLGEVSRQVVIGGSRVNLNEVDAMLRDHKGVTAAAAVTVPSGDGAVLVAFAEVAMEVPAELAGLLRAAALATLPPAAVPEHVICLHALPRTAGGEPDHEALTELAAHWLAARAAEPAPDADYPLVQDLIRLWRQLLKVDVTADTAFFDAGGHSLLAAKLAQDVEELTGVHLELPEIFSHQTPAALAARLGLVAAGQGSHG